MSPMNKELIRRRFQKARRTYDQNAVVQTLMANELVAMIRRFGGLSFSRVLEIGCGTGLLTQRLLHAFEITSFWANDLVPNSNPNPSLTPRTTYQFLPGDAEHVSGFPTGLQLIVSGATFQWFQNTQACFGKLHALMAPEGLLAFSSFGPDNFRELKNLPCPSLPYLSLVDLARLAEPWFDVLHLHETRNTLCFPDAKAVFRHMQTLGVNGLTTHVFSKSQLHHLLSLYQLPYARQAGVPLTYHPTYCVLRKKTSCP